jgi:two-component system, NtrC family, response regulator AtoC
MAAEPRTTSCIEAESWFVWGQSPAIQPLNKLLVELAATNIPILLAGESGTGKDTYARAIHFRSGGAPHDFTKLVCAGLDSQQLFRELQSAREADICAVRPHTIYLDEIEMLSPDCQRQLLTYLSDSGIKDPGRMGNVRLISATTRDLEEQVEEGKFRRELYFRINGACLPLPPLRERVEDIAPLATHLLHWQAEEFKKRPPALDQETKELLMAYHWPGNIRELENTTRKMVVLGDADLALQDLRVARMVRSTRGTQGELSSLKKAARAASRQTERELILRALQRTKWNRKRAAQELQISYKSLLYKLKQIETPAPKNEE